MKIELYRDNKKEWRWRIIKRGRIIAASSEGYKRRIGAYKNILTVKGVLSFALVTAMSDHQIDSVTV